MVAGDWFWGGGPPPPVWLPYSWISRPLRFRPHQPITAAEVSDTSGTTARSRNATSYAEYREYLATAVLDTAIQADPVSLAAYLTDNHTVQRMACPTLLFDLLPRADNERALLLGISEGMRIVITGVPATWPEGAHSLIVEGVHHVIGLSKRTVAFTTSPVVGTTAGDPGPWLRADASTIGGTDTTPF